MKYLIWSGEHLAWWKQSRRGYTLSVRQAGQFTLKAALEITDNANRHSPPGSEPEEYMVPLRLISEVLLARAGADLKDEEWFSAVDD